MIPAYSLPDQNQRVLLAHRPNGIPLPEHFVIETQPLGELAPGALRVRNLYLSVDAAQRGWSNSDANYSAPIPLGSVMRALAVGVVVESRSPNHAVGSVVYGWTGWQDYADITPDQVLTHVAAEDLKAPLSAYAGVLGINGLTASLALHGLGHPKPGETVFVSTAAGAVGSIVTQLARHAGCRVVGSTGSADKARACVERYGCDAAIDYKREDLDARLGELAPDGLDVFFDNVGGETLDVAIRRMRTGGRIVQCGTASIAAWSPPPIGRRPEREVLTRRLSWSGFVIFDHIASFQEARRGLESLIVADRLTYSEDIAAGIAAAPGAIQRLYAGENTGKQLIFIG